MNAIHIVGALAGACLALVATARLQDDFTKVRPVAGIEPYQDVRYKDMSAIDFTGRVDLPATLCFNQKSIWSKSMPAGVDPAKLLTDAMNPGLGIRKLHAQGWTGKGVNLAIIDQPVLQDHPEFAGKFAAYFDVGCQSDSSMHGPGVASLLVGSRCGVAPGARLYYVAAPTWTLDAAYQAQALDWLVKRNAGLRKGQKILAVSVSAAPSGRGSPFTKNTEQWTAARERAEKAGILVVDCTTDHGFVGPCYYDSGDRESPSKCRSGFPGIPSEPYAHHDLLAPCSQRTTAEEYVKGACDYVYWGRGGLSWSIPYCTGVLALGRQARPDLSPFKLRELLFKSACKLSDGSLVIDPPNFIKEVRAAKPYRQARH